MIHLESIPILEDLHKLWQLQGCDGNCRFKLAQRILFHPAALADDKHLRKASQPLKNIKNRSEMVWIAIKRYGKISWISSKNQPQPVRCHFSWHAAGTGFHELDGSSVRGVEGSFLFQNSQIQLIISWQMTTGFSLHLKLDSKIWLQNFWSLH